MTHPPTNHAPVVVSTEAGRWHATTPAPPGARLNCPVGTAHCPACACLYSTSSSSLMKSRNRTAKDDRIEIWSSIMCIPCGMGQGAHRGRNKICQYKIRPCNNAHVRLHRSSLVGLIMGSSRSRTFSINQAFDVEMLVTGTRVRSEPRYPSSSCTGQPYHRTEFRVTGSEFSRWWFMDGPRHAPPSDNRWY